MKPDEPQRPAVEGVETLTMLLREDDGTPKRAGLIVDWSNGVSYDHPTGDSSDPVTGRLLRHGWALMIPDPDQECPLVGNYHISLDGLSAHIVGPGDRPGFRLVNLAVTDEWPDVSWVDVAVAQRVVRVMAGNIGLSTRGSAPPAAFETAVSNGRVVVADLPLHTAAGRAHATDVTE